MASLIRDPALVLHVKWGLLPEDLIPSPAIGIASAAITWCTTSLINHSISSITPPSTPSIFSQILRTLTNSLADFYCIGGWARSVFYLYALATVPTCFRVRLHSKYCLEPSLTASSPTQHLSPNMTTYSPTTHPYRNAPLDLDDRCIRLIDLHSLANGILQCKFLICPLEGCPEFVALSYTWGSPSPTREISLNGHQFFVRENLYLALANIVGNRQIIQADLRSVRQPQLSISILPNPSLIAAVSKSRPKSFSFTDLGRCSMYQSG